VLCNIQLKFKKLQKGIQGPKPINVEMLKDNTMAEMYRSRMSHIFEGVEMSTNVNERLNQITEAVRSVATEVVGIKRKTRKPWIIMHTLTLADEKRAAKAKKLSSAHDRKNYDYLSRQTKESANKDKKNSGFMHNV